MNKINRPIYPFGIERSFHCECCEKTLRWGFTNDSNKALVNAIKAWNTRSQ